MMRPDVADRRVGRRPVLARFGRFSVVSVVGVAVQTAVLSFALSVLSMHYLAAAGMGVAAAVLHNFFWHRRWTWHERACETSTGARPFARFVLANGLVSVVTQLLVVRALAGFVGWPPVVASLAAVAAAGILNFHLADRLVFPAALSARTGHATEPAPFP